MKKLESQTKKQKKKKEKETSILPSFHFKIVSISITTKFITPCDNQVEVCAYMKHQFVIQTSGKSPSARSPGGLTFSPQPFHWRGSDTWGCPRKGCGPREQRYPEGFWCVQCWWSRGWQGGSSGPAVLISALQNGSIHLPASSRYNQVR